jgi:hypothetical protein
MLRAVIRSAAFDEGRRLRKRHLIPQLGAYGLDSFEDFFAERRILIVGALKAL